MDDSGMFDATPPPVWPDGTKEEYDPNRKLLDLVFVQDCTGSQGSYIVNMFPA